MMYARLGSNSAPYISASIARIATSWKITWMRCRFCENEFRSFLIMSTMMSPSRRRIVFDVMRSTILIALLYALCLSRIVSMWASHVEYRAL